MKAHTRQWKVKKLGKGEGVSSKLFESCMEAGGLFMVSVITEVAVNIATQHAPLSSACMPDPRVLFQYI